MCSAANVKLQSWFDLMKVNVFYKKDGFDDFNFMYIVHSYYWIITHVIGNILFLDYH